MTQGFNKWLAEYNGNIAPTESAYKAGAASRQAEIDGLQKRIDDALELIKTKFNPSKYQIIEILKGDSDGSF